MSDLADVNSLFPKSICVKIIIQFAMNKRIVTDYDRTVKMREKEEFMHSKKMFHFMPIVLLFLSYFW